MAFVGGVFLNGGGGGGSVDGGACCRYLLPVVETVLRTVPTAESDMQLVFGDRRNELFGCERTCDDLKARMRFL